MTLRMNYPDTATFVQVETTRYAGKKVKTQQFDVDVIFVQGISMRHFNFQDAIESDAICYPNPENASIVALANRLEGMYILMPLYGADDDIAWFKITKATVNRDHLLNNTIDNIELLLKKATPVPGVS